MFTSCTFQSASLHLSHRYAPRWLSTISCPTCTRGIIIVNCWIMVIELSGVQFCLKSHARFQNRMSKLPKFDLKSQVWFQKKIIQHKVQLPLYYSQFDITEFSQYRFIDQASSQFVEKGKHEKAFTTQKWSHVEKKMVRFKTGMMRFRTNKWHNFRTDVI